MQPHPVDVKRVGLIAGQGHYPIYLAKALKSEGYEVVCMGVRDHADPVLAEICDVFVWKGMGKFGWATRFFRKHDVKYATLAGKIQKVRLYDPLFIWRQAPDLYTIRLFADHFLRRREDCKNDSLLNTVCRAFEKRGIIILPGTDFAPELLVERKLLTKRAPTSAQLQDVFFGWKIARAIGRLDVGQSVSVKNRDVLAVEAIEGTDEAIKRAGKLCKSKNFVVVKIAKPHQDMRFDVPTFGLGTVQTMAEAGACVLAFEAGKSLLIDAEETIAYADEHNIAMIAIIEEDIDNPAAEAEFTVSDKRLAVGAAASANPE